MFFRKWCYGAGAMAILLAVSTGAFAVPLTFSLDESSSQLTVQGAFAGFETVAHNTSVTSSVSGSLMIDVDNVSAPNRDSTNCRLSTRVRWFSARLVT